MADRFRQKKEPPHVRIYHAIIDTEAWHHLSGNAVKVLLAVCRYNNGKNNGSIYFSDRTGAKDTGLARNTVRRSLAELIDRGFLRCTKPGSFNQKALQAATYRLTWVAWPGGDPAAPSHEYRGWKVETEEKNRAQILTETGSNCDTRAETSPAGGSDFEQGSLETPRVSVTPQMSEIEPQVFYQVERRSAPETDHRKQGIPASRAFLASLRTALAEHLKHAELGEQTRLANDLGIPGGTLSKFANGKGLPERHAAALARALMAEAE